MTDETTVQMEHRWALLMAARDSRTGVRLHDTDLNYQRECMALRTQIEERKAAEAGRPQINSRQLEQLQWLEDARRTMTAEVRDKDGNVVESSKPLMLEMSERGSKFRSFIDQSARVIASGGDISKTIENTARDMQARGMTLQAPAPQRTSYRDMDGNMMGHKQLMPDSHYQNPPGALPTARTEKV